MGGLSIAGQRIFPAATVYVDAAHCLDEDAERRVPQARRATFQSRQTVGPYVATGAAQDLSRSCYTAPRHSGRSAAWAYTGARAIAGSHCPGRRSPDSLSLSLSEIQNPILLSNQTTVLFENDVSVRLPWLVRVKS